MKRPFVCSLYIVGAIASSAAFISEALNKNAFGVIVFLFFTWTNLGYFFSEFKKSD